MLSAPCIPPGKNRRAFLLATKIPTGFHRHFRRGRRYREANMKHHPDDVTRLMLALVIAGGFIAVLLTLSLRGTPKGNEYALDTLLATLGSGVGLVVGYYFKRGA